MFGQRRRDAEVEAIVLVTVWVARAAIVKQREETKRLALHVRNKELEYRKETPKLEAPKSKQIMSFVKSIQNG